MCDNSQSIWHSFKQIKCQKDNQIGVKDGLIWNAVATKRTTVRPSVLLGLSVCLFVRLSHRVPHVMWHKVLYAGVISISQNVQ